MISNQQVLSRIQKAELVLADLSTDGGYLLPEQATEFFRIAINESTLIGMCNVKPLKSHTYRLPKIKFNGRILRRASEGSALPVASRSKPTTSQTEIVTKLCKAEVRLNDEVLEDNVEGEALKTTVMQLIAEKSSADMEEIGIAADTSSSDFDLAIFDGILKQSTTHVVAGGSVPLTKNLLQPTLRAMPKEFRKDKKKLRFLTSTNAEQDYRNSLAERATVVGDKFLETDAPTMFSGVPIEAIPLFPEDYAGTTTKVLLTDPKNIIWGVWRQVKVETDKDVTSGELIVVTSLRYAVKFEHEPASVRTDAVSFLS